MIPTMGAFLSYSLTSGLLMLAMYLAYRLFLARDNQHSFNRAVLLLVYIVSFAASPLLFSIGSAASSAGAPAGTSEGIEIANLPIAPHSTPAWATAALWIFMAGMAATAARTAATWVRLTRIVRSGEKIRRDGYTLVVTSEQRFAPFSWMHYVVISRADFDSDCHAIITHELEHVRCRHRIDLLAAQAVCIVNWFNPAAWLMRDELMLVHEYQADMAVIDSGHDTQQYQLLLIKKAVGARFPSLANSLNHSKLKKRITMMYKEKSGAGPKIKALALVPMLALALGVAGVPAVRAAVTTIGSSEISTDKGSENPSKDKTSVKVFKVTNINNNNGITTVTIKGTGLGNSLSVSGGTFTTAGKTYQANGLKCNMTDGEAVITATFPMTSEYENSSMTLLVNGEEIPFNLEKFFDRAQSVAVGSSTGSRTISSIVINGSESTYPTGMDFYLDGKKISEAEMQAVSPDRIASVTVDTENHAIRIALKK
ncbi:MAG: M56 family metallopeptidase [Muribaculaceae bacterium]|nr:M56 family metallopeptidase [Muribaculaceae bacterium]